MATYTLSDSLSGNRKLKFVNKTEADIEDPSIDPLPANYIPGDAYRGAFLLCGAVVEKTGATGADKATFEVLTYNDLLDSWNWVATVEVPATEPPEEGVKSRGRDFYTPVNFQTCALRMIDCTEDTTVKGVTTTLVNRVNAINIE